MLSMKNSKKHLEYYEGLDTLPLEVFCKIINTGNYLLLKVDGKNANPEICLNIWGDLMLEYSKLDNSPKVKANFDKLTYVRQLENAYNTIKGMIRLLWMVTPNHPKHGHIAKQYIDDLKKMGYIVNVSNSLEYRASLVAADKKANSLVTYIQMKKNELEKDKVHDEEGIDYDDLMAFLMEHFNITGEVTVKRYLRCKQRIKAKYAKKQEKQ